MGDEGQLVALLHFGILLAWFGSTCALLSKYIVIPTGPFSFMMKHFIIHKSTLFKAPFHRTQRLTDAYKNDVNYLLWPSQ